MQQREFLTLSIYGGQIPQTPSHVLSLQGSPLLLYSWAVLDLYEEGGKAYIEKVQQ